ncbi:hypothetical protein DL768_008429 [Monosporascus sp. mg162]|nr:hypothetical protein DL768_008429 [Monosporascus sp. mg162]
MLLVNLEPESLPNLKDKIIFVLGTVILAFTLLFSRCSFSVDAATYTELINASPRTTIGIGAAVIRQLTAEPNIKATPLKSDIEAKVVRGQRRRAADPGLAPRTNGRDVLQFRAGPLQDGAEAHGRVDHAVYSAGMAGPDEDGRLFDTVTASPSSPIEEEPSMRVLDVNLRGALFFTRVAAHHLRESLAAAKGEGSVPGREGETDDDAAPILLVSSSNGIAGFAGRLQYCAGKHGILGLFRGARSTLSATGGGVGSRMNVVVPSVTSTQMISKFLDTFASRGLMCKKPDDVSSAIAQALASRADGEAYYVAGSKTYEIEKRLEALRA